KLSIIIPVYNEENNVEMLHSQLKGVLRKYNYEIIFVDDGSTDDTFNNLNKIEDKALKIIKLRNVGDAGSNSISNFSINEQTVSGLRSFSASTIPALDRV
ncbi:MAG: glycosyltransferase, partial [Bacteroidetes bacterium]|nr:glycosyltransferase [Bacteroidota bacterium]